jgi:hypothetical protein
MMLFVLVIAFFIAEAAPILCGGALVDDPCGLAG